jgi:hypothetical protein
MNSLQNNLVPFVPFVQGTSCTISTNEHRYSLEKGSTKHLCPDPDCHKRTFVLYIDTETGEYLPEKYGRCDRESKCSYHLNPYLDGYAKAIWEQERGKRSEIPHNWKQKKAIPQPPPEAVFFDFETFKQTLQNYEANKFIQNLLFKVQFPFEVSDITKIIDLYRLGTVSNGYRAGANTFPFIDLNGKIRAIQVKQFDEQNHTTGTDFLHSIIEKHHARNNKPLPEWLEAYTKQDKKISCLFGEHLLSKYHSNPVALVEAPKTAVYGSLYFGLPETPEDLIWLAVYNKSSFSFDKLKVLQGRFVYVFPDLSKDGHTFKEWETKAKDFEKRIPGTRFIFSDLLEHLAPKQDKSEGKDIADYLINQNWRLFRKQRIEEQPTPEPLKNVDSVDNVDRKKPLFFPRSILPKTEQIEQPVNWNIEISELENYFENIEFPTQPIQLNQCSTIIDCSLFVKNHLETIKANNGKKTYLPYLNRLKNLKQVLHTKSN